jgi:chromosomal replication initiation ATPase DnaA
MSSRQLTFDLPARPALGRADFFISPANALALAALDAPAGWPLGKFILIGPRGSGKTHLAMVWAAANAASVITAEDLPRHDPGDLATQPAIVIEDADHIASNLAAETALFHLHNLILAAHGRLLLTAATAPSRWPFALPDLASRLQATASTTLAPPDDALLAAVLVKLFADRQIAAAPALVSYLVSRIDRSLASASALVETLDARALAEARPVNRALAADVLDTWTPAAP